MERFWWTTQLVLITVIGIVWTHPLDIYEGATKTSMETTTTEQANTSKICHYKRGIYREGNVINIDEPCLSCICRKGSLVCHRRVCPDLPDPPPPGCVILHKQGQCCPLLLCEEQKEEDKIEVRTELTNSRNNGCVINGTLYAEGSALASSSLCEYCYCIQGRQKCIKPHCTNPQNGCTPTYREHSCCPTHYDCENASLSAPLTRSEGCEVNGVIYPEGDMVPSLNESVCENCYCMMGQVRCALITCLMNDFEGCKPVYSFDKCCPSSYDCSKILPPLSDSVRSFLERTAGLTTSGGRSYPETVTTSTEISELNTTTETETETETETTETSTFTTTTQDVEGNSSDFTTIVTDTEPTVTQKSSQMELQERIDEVESTSQMSSQVTKSHEVFPETTTALYEGSVQETDVTTFPPKSFNSISILTKNNDVFDVTLNGKMDLVGSSIMSNSSDSVASPLDELVRNRPSVDEDYDVYDYSEPQLPPSLPNLVIFPFVAADAVVKDQQPSKTFSYDQSSIKREDTESPVYYKNYFSPPTKTEGGFVPKEPSTHTVDLYKDEASQVEGSSGIIPPSITMPPKLKTEHCFSEGREYRHGELVSDPGECTSCVCFYGEVICQEAVCPSVQPGCKRTKEKDLNSCCGRVVCDEDPVPSTGLLEKLDDHRMSPHHKQPVVNLITAADTIDVTPDPFRDVIRTEPAPDLPSLMSDMLPIYLEPQTKKPVSVTYKNVVVEYYPDFSVTTTRENVQKGSEKYSVIYSTTMFPQTETTKISPIFQPTDTTSNAPTTESQPYQITTNKPLANTTEMVKDDTTQNINRITTEPPTTTPLPVTTTTTTTTTTTESPSTTTPKPTNSTMLATTTKKVSTPSQKDYILTTKLPDILRTTPRSNFTKTHATSTKTTSGKPTSTVTKRPLIGIRPKPTKKPIDIPTTTSESSFFDDFFKGLFENGEEFHTLSTVTTVKPPTTKRKYSSKIKSKTTETTSSLRGTASFTSTKPSTVEKSDIDDKRHKLENKNSVEDSFSLDSVFQLFFNAESTSPLSTPMTTTSALTTKKYSSSTRKPVKKTASRRTTKVPLTSPARTSTTLSTNEIETATKEAIKRVSLESSMETTSAVNATIPISSASSTTGFSIVEVTGLPKEQIWQQSTFENLKIPKTTPKPEPSESYFQKQIPAKPSLRKPTKTSQDLGSILKLAGCNIYGRMYRVGKIIVELSGPCLECMCTDLGVQCAELRC